MSRLIDADALYERACSLEAQALDYVGKLIERDGDKVSVEWRIWSAILAERTAFKHDVFDAPTIKERKTGRWIYKEDLRQFFCSQCGEPSLTDDDRYIYGMDFSNFCPNCGVKMER